jgi:hypothetical protein
MMITSDSGITGQRQRRLMVDMTLSRNAMWRNESALLSALAVLSEVTW